MPTPLPKSCQDEIALAIEHITQNYQASWYQHAAAEAFWAGQYKFIPSRDRTGLYLCRFWITPPHLRGNLLDSASSVLLHWMWRADEDEHLHDHPWDFETMILAGGYWEEVISEVTGEKVQYFRKPRQRLKRARTDFHRVASLPIDGPPLSDTWTMVHTGPRHKDWGFLQEDGRVLPHAQYLGL